MDSKSYKTRQRDKLLDFFKENPDKCFLAKDIIKNEKIDLGEATIYRSLSKFVSDGILKKFISPDGDGSYYQYNPKNSQCKKHFHLKCTECGKLFHMDCSFMEKMCNHILESHDFYLDNSKTTLYGICGDCNKKKNENRIMNNENKKQ